MKYLVAIGMYGYRNDHDFSWTINGEPVVISTTQCNKKGCGCKCSYTGILSRKATTNAMVFNIEDTIDGLAKKDALGFWGQAWDELSNNQKEVMIESRKQEITNIMEQIKNIPVGTIVNYRGTKVKEK